MDPLSSNRLSAIECANWQRGGGKHANGAVGMD